jgi:hypothetical protein
MENSKLDKMHLWFLPSTTHLAPLSKYPDPNLLFASTLEIHTKEWLQMTTMISNLHL